MPVVGSGSLFLIKDFQLRGADEFLNTYWYYSTATPSSVPIATVVTAFEGVLTAWLPPAQPVAVAHTVLEGDEVTSQSNFISRASAIPSGTLVAPYLANYQAAGIRLLRTTKETRSGWKRYAAGNEAVIDGNGWTAPFLVILDNLAAVLNDFLTIGVDQLDPVIVRQTRDPVTGDLLPPAQWIYNIIASVEVKQFVTTQNTRKLGRGV